MIVGDPAGALSQPGWRLTERNQFELRCRPASAVVTLHEPVFVDCAITNRSSAPQEIDLGANRADNFVLSIAPPAGPAIDDLRHQTSGMAASGEIEIGPQAEHRERLLLQRWYGFAAVGRYSIVVRLVLPDVRLSSPGFTLEVLPRDPERLMAVCETLAGAALARGDAESSSLAAEALAQVADSIAIPFLERLLAGSHSVRHTAIAGLGRVDDAAARTLLEELSRDRDRDTAALARRALRGDGRATVMD